jgi:hypothetical protein
MGEGDFLSFDPFTRAPDGQWGCLWSARTGRTVNGQVRDRVGTPGEFRVRTGVFLPQLLIRSSECVSQARLDLTLLTPFSSATSVPREKHLDATLM